MQTLAEPQDRKGDESEAALDRRLTWAGVELGGTKCIAVLARGPDDVLARETVATTSPEQTLGSIAETLSNWQRLEERRGGKEGRSRRATYH